MEPSLQFDSLKKEDNEESASVFRLSCGHAFHSTCLCRLWRTGTQFKCPLCCVSDVSTNHEQDSNLTITVEMTDGRHFEIVQYNDVDDDDESYLPNEQPDFSELVVASELVSQLELGKRNRARQVAKAAFAKTLKKYKAYELELLQKRRLALQGALQTFKEKHFAKFLLLKRLATKQLKKLKAIDRSLLVQSTQLNSTPSEMHQNGNSQHQQVQVEPTQQAVDGAALQTEVEPLTIQIPTNASNLVNYFDASELYKSRYSLQNYINCNEMQPLRYKFWKSN